LRTGRASENDHQPEDTYEDSDQDSHLTSAELQKSERSLVDISVSGITDSGYHVTSTTIPPRASPPASPRK
jgi:hypothetical protein